MNLKAAQKIVDYLAAQVKNGSMPEEWAFDEVEKASGWTAQLPKWKPSTFLVRRDLAVLRKMLTTKLKEEQEAGRPPLRLLWTLGGNDEVKTWTALCTTFKAQAGNWFRPGNFYYEIEGWGNIVDGFTSLEDAKAAAELKIVELARMTVKNLAPPTPVTKEEWAVVRNLRALGGPS